MVAMASIYNNLKCATVNDIPSTQPHLTRHQTSQLVIVGVIIVVIGMNLETVQRKVNREQWIKCGITCTAINTDCILTCISQVWVEVEVSLRTRMPFILCQVLTITIKMVAHLSVHGSMTSIKVQQVEEQAILCQHG